MPEERLDPKSTALVVFDMQKGQLGIPWRKKFLEETDVVQKCAELIALAREKGMPIFYVENVRQKNGKDQPPVISDESIANAGKPPEVSTIPDPERWETLDELAPQPEDFRVGKIRWGSFHYTQLESLLRTNKIDTVIVSGVRTQVGVETTLRDGRELGFNMISARDATGGCEQDLHNYLMDNVFPMFCRVRTVAQLRDMLA
jgi:nicotinamidase-related amidase